MALRRRGPRAGRDPCRGVRRAAEKISALNGVAGRAAGEVPGDWRGDQMIRTIVLGCATRRSFLGRLAVGGLLLVGATSIQSQTPQGEAAKEPKAYTPPPIFKEAQAMEFTLIAPF